MDTSLLRTVCFVPGEKSPYIFSKFNPLNMDTPLIRTLSMPPPPPPTLSVLLQCDYFHRGHLNKIDQLDDRKVTIQSETVSCQSWHATMELWSNSLFDKKKRLTSDVYFFGHLIQNHSSCSCWFSTVCPIWAGLNQVALFGSERGC